MPCRGWDFVYNKELLRHLKQIRADSENYMEIEMSGLKVIKAKMTQFEKVIRICKELINEGIPLNDSDQTRLNFANKKIKILKITADKIQSNIEEYQSIIKYININIYELLARTFPKRIESVNSTINICKNLANKLFLTSGKAHLKPLYELNDTTPDPRFSLDRFFQNIETQKIPTIILFPKNPNSIQ